MADPQLPPTTPKGLLYAIRFMIVVGFIALAYVILQSISVPKSNFERFAEGSLEKLVVLNNPPPQPVTIFSDPDGQKTSLADFHGKYVLFNIWATWCPPCIAEIPSLDALQSEQGNENFEVVAVSLDFERVNAESFLKTKNIANLRLYSDTTMTINGAVGVEGLPISIIYDPNGLEVARIPGEVNWQSAEARALLQAILP